MGDDADEIDAVSCRDWPLPKADDAPRSETALPRLRVIAHAKKKRRSWLAAGRVQRKVGRSGCPLHDRRLVANLRP